MDRYVLDPAYNDNLSLAHVTESVTWIMGLSPCFMYVLKTKQFLSVIHLVSF